MDLEELRLKIVADFNGLDKACSKVKSATSQLRSMFGQTSKSGEKIGDGITRGAEKGKKALGGLGKAIKSIGFAMAGAGLLSFGKDCVSLASDLQEIQNVVDVVFGNMSGKVEEFAQTALQMYGLTETQTKKFMGTYGAMWKSLGADIPYAEQMSEQMTALVGDVASFYNLSEEEASNKLMGILTGETEALKGLGVVMTQDALNAYALSQGYAMTYDSMSMLEKAQLRMAFVEQALADANGDFARSQNSWANQTRILSGQWASFKANLGAGFMVVLAPIIKGLNMLMGKLVQLSNLFAKVMSKIFKTPLGSVGGAVSESVEGAIGNGGEETSGLQDAIGGIGDGISDTVDSAGDLGGALSNAEDNAGGLGDAVDGVARGMANTVDSAVEANKELKKLMGIDTIHKINGDNGNGSGSGSGSGSSGSGAGGKGSGVGGSGGGAGGAGDLGGIGDTGAGGVGLADAVDEEASKSEDRIDRMAEKIKSVLMKLFEPIRMAWSMWGEGFVNSFKTMIGNIGGLIASIATAWFNVWIGGAGYVTVSFILGILTNIFDIIGLIAGSFQRAWDNCGVGQSIIQGIADLINDILYIIEDIGNSFEVVWKKVGDRFADNVLKVIKDVIDIAKLLGKELKQAWDNGGQHLFESLLELGEAVFDLFSNIFDDLITPLMETMGSGLGETLGTVADALGTIVDVVTTIIDTISNNPILLTIVETILSMVGAFKVVTKVISVVETVVLKCMYAFDGIKKAIDIARGAISIFTANPILIAIAAVIAIIVLLITHWDEVKKYAKIVVDFVVEAWNTCKSKVCEFVSGLVNEVKNWFNNMKDGISNIINNVKTTLTNIWNNIKTTVVNIVTGIKDGIVNKFNSAKDGISNVINNIKNGISNGFNNAKNTALNIFQSIKDGIVGKIQGAWDSITGVIDRIKNAFNFHWSLPSIKLPHFHVSGSMNPIDWIKNGVPKFSVEWYAKGGIMTNPTMFGMNGNNPMIGGEAGAEGIIPLNALWKQMDKNNNNLVNGVVNGLAQMLTDNDGGNITINNTLKMDGREIGKAVVKYVRDETKRTGINPILT